MIPKALTVAENGRRLYIFGEGRAQAFNLDKKLSTYGAVQIEEVRECMVLPFYADGHLILAAAKDGLFSFDESTKESKQEVSGELTYTAVSPNGRLICAAEIRKATLLHLAEPDVSVTAEPIGSLKRGKYTQLQVKIRNCGSQTAFRVSVKLTGAFTFQDITLPGELAAGAESVYNKQSIQPSEEGALPIRLIVEYEDEYGLSYSREDAQVLQVEPGAYK